MSGYLPYYDDGTCQIFHGDAIDLLMTGIQAHCAITDPPYGETSLEWDHWPGLWPDAVAWATNSLWCFGTLRMIEVTGQKDDVTQDFYRIAAEEWPHLVEQGYLKPKPTPDAEESR